MEMPRRRIPVSLQIDTNRINARASLKAMNRLEALKRDGVLFIGMSEVAQTEARAGRHVRRRQKATEHIATITYAESPDEQETRRKIEAILFPDGVADISEKNDVEIVFNAKKYGEILVTADGGSKRQPGGILGNRAALEQIGVRVMTDAEALAFVGIQIELRDNTAREAATFTGEPLPSWVGKDTVT